MCRRHERARRIVNDALDCDEQWYRIMGRDPAHPVRSVSDFEPFIHPDDRSRATEVVRTAAHLLATDEDYAILFRIVRPDGDVRWIRSAAYVEHHDELPVRAVGFVIDPTQLLRRSDRALYEAKARGRDRYVVHAVEA